MRRLSAFCLCLALALGGGQAHAEDDGLVRLPGQGELKPDAAHIEGIGRLVPGGGLLLSFDTDKDMQITPAEISAGIEAAFLKADENEDGRITPLEQIKWTETLPTRDASLANPARFDPNLDRSVRDEEFRDVIFAFAAIHADEQTGIISVTNLKSTQQERLPQEEAELAPDRRETEDTEAPARTRRTAQRQRRTGGGS